MEARLHELTGQHPNLSVEIVLSQPRKVSARRKGSIVEAVSADFTSFENYKAYIAGPPAMVEALQEVLREKGMALRDIHADAFYSQADDALSIG